MHGPVNVKRNVSLHSECIVFKYEIKIFQMNTDSRTRFYLFPQPTIIIRDNRHKLIPVILRLADFFHHYNFV